MNYFKERLNYFIRKLDGNPKYKKIFLVSGITLLSLVFIVFIVRPGVTGYVTYKKIQDINHTIDSFQSELGRLQYELNDSETELGEIREKYESSSSELADLTSRNSEYQSRINSLESTLSSKTNELEDLEEELEEKSEKADELEEDFDILAQDAANKICCIKKQLEDSNIGYYEVEDGKILCKTSGDDAISCA